MSYSKTVCILFHILPTWNEAANASDGGKAVEVIPVTPVDEFCSNEEFDRDTLSEENSVTYKVIVQDPALSNNKESFKSQVNEIFSTSEVEMSNRLFEIFGYEQLEDQSKLYIKIKNDKKAIEAIQKMKSEIVFMRKLPVKKSANR